MILTLTNNGNTFYLDTSLIAFVFQDGGNVFVTLNTEPIEAVRIDPALSSLVWDSSGLYGTQTIRIAETYAEIVAYTDGYGFHEFNHAAYTYVLVNCAAVHRVQAVSGDALILFRRYASVQTTDAMADVMTAINLAVNGKDTTDASIADQVGFDVDTYVADSNIIIPSHGFALRSMFYWRISASKTADGLASPVYSIRVGTGLSTLDTAILQLTGSPQTADTDNGVLHVMATVRAIGTLTVVQGSAWWVHKGKSGSHAVGFCEDNTGQVDGTSATFDSTAFAGQYIGLSIDAGTDAAWTITQVHSQVNW